MHTKHYAFFQNRECEFFPCHATNAPADFNCLFCFCPLYGVPECGGCYTYTKDGMKDCSACLLPHQRENFRLVIRRLCKATGKKETDFL